jgi:hypothetical protein
MKDRRTVEIVRVLAGIRSALGIPQDTRGDLMRAFAADDAVLEELHAALGRVIEVAADKPQPRRRGTRRRL